jgi:disulfide bond formation protein DsbB
MTFGADARSPEVQATGLTAPAAAAAIVAVGAAATVGAALFMQYAMGVLPCELCYKERWPYYAGTVLALVALGVARSRPRSALTVALLALLALVFLAGAVVGGYHAGVEYKWWAGPSDCTGPVGEAVGMDTFLKQLETVKVVRCDEVSMRILGLSLAAWNAVISAGLAVVAAVGAIRARA